MGVILRGIRPQGRILISSFNRFGGSTLDFLTQPGNILTELDGVTVEYPLLTNALPGEQLTFMISAGTLPSGVTLNILTGVISGTPASVNDTTTYFFTVVAQKVGGVSTSRTFNMTVIPNPQPEFAPMTDPDGKPIPVTEGGIKITEFKPVVIHTNGIGFKPGFTYAVTAGSLPTGLVLDADTGVISGASAAIASDYVRAATITMSSGTKTANLPLVFSVVKNSAPAFATAADLGSALGGGYFQAAILTTDVDAEAVTLSVAEGSSLPQGMALNGNIVSGTLPATTDADVTHTFTLNATDGHQVTSRQFQIVALLNVNPVFKNAPEYDVLTGAAQTRKFEAVDPNNVNAITLTQKSSTLPPEVTFDASTGNLVGTFTTAGSYELVLEASNGELVTEQTFTFYVAENLAPVWDTPAGELLRGIGKVPFDIPLVATDPNGSLVTFSLAGGALPNGVTITPTGRLAGTPDQTVAPGVTYTFTLRASDGLLHTDREFTIYIDRNDDPIWNTNSAMGAAYEGTLFTSPPLSAYDVDGQAVRIEVAANGLPNHWTFDPVTNVVSGMMPATAKNSTVSFTMVANDGTPSLGNGKTRRRFDITNLFNKMPVWTTETLPKAVERDIYDTTLVAQNPGNVGFTFTLLSGALPSGLTLAANGRISGTVAAAAQDENYTFTVRVTNEIGSADREFTMLVEHNIAPVWTTAAGNLLTTLANNAVEIALAATDANGTPLTYSAVTPLPAGLTLSPQGLITGKTAIAEEEVVAEFVVAVSDRVFSIERTFTITTLADSDPIWTTGADLGKILEGRSTTITLTATDPERAPLTYTLKSGALPSGIVFDAARNQITGTTPEVTEDTTYTFEIEATDGRNIISRTFTLVVENNLAPVWVTPAHIGSFRSGGKMDFAFEATDPNGTAVQLSFVQGTLPPGSSFINGAIRTPGNTTLNIVDVDTDYTFTIRASDGRFNTDRVFTATVTKNSAPVWISEGLLFEGNEGQSFEVDLLFSDPEDDEVTVDNKGLPQGYAIVGNKLTGTLPSVNQTTTSNLTLSITDGASVVARTFQLKTNFSTAPKWSTAPALGSNLREGTSFSRQLQAFGGPNGTTYAPKGAMPGSLQVTSTGLVYGNLPLIDVATQNVSFTVTATNSIGSTDRTFTIGVVNNMEPVWTRPSGFVHIGKENTPFSITTGATDADDATLTYSVVSGALPAGATLNTSTGAITGTLPIVDADTVYDFVLGVADNSVRVDRAYKIRAQNVMAFAMHDLTGIGSPATAVMIVEGQVAGNWSTYTGASDRTLTVTPPANAVFDHGRDIPAFTYTVNNVTGVASPTTAGINSDATVNPLFDGHAMSLNTTTAAASSASFQDNSSSNPMFTSSTVTNTTTPAAATSATQNT